MNLRFGLHISALVGGLLALGASPSSAQTQQENIPALASADFGWQSNIGDWQDPPAGFGRGPIAPDPDHPYTSNYDAGQGKNGGQPTLRLGNYKDPVLKPWAATFMQETNEEALSGKRAVPFAAQSRCYPGGVPGQLLYPFEPVFFIQLPDEVWMIWQRDHMVRRIRLADKHLDNVKPSWFGDSIGHYENGDTLVVDTIGLQTKNSYIDNFRTPHTEALHVVERFTISADGKTLTGIATVEDPDTFNEPFSMMQRWRKSDGRILETVCAENNGDHFSENLFPIPEAKTPDF